jgi:hypothetical protein
MPSSARQIGPRTKVEKKNVRKKTRLMDDSEEKYGRASDSPGIMEQTLQYTPRNFPKALPMVGKSSILAYNKRLRTLALIPRGPATNVIAEL